MTPYSEQLKAVKAFVAEHRGIISAVTGSGKSLIAALIINELQVRTLIVVPSVELKEQLTVSMRKWFGASKVGKNKDIYVENVQAFDPKEIIKGYDALIIDEFHHSGAHTYQKLNKTAWQNIYYRCGMTATPFRSNEEETILLESVLSQIVFDISYATAVVNKYIVPVDAYYIEIPKQKTDAYTWAEVYSQLVVKNDARNLAISRLLLALTEEKKSTLCLVKEVAHGQELSDITGIPFVNGQDEESRDYIRQFNSGSIKALIGTEGILGEGVDTKPCEFVIIAGLGKAKSAFMQKVGRAVRTYPGKESAKVCIIKDQSHKFLLRHYKAQVTILKEEYGIDVTKLDV